MLLDLTGFLPSKKYINEAFQYAPMEKEVKQDILAVLKQAIQILKKEDYAQLKELSNHTIHNASIYQDNDSIFVAVIIYSIYKIAARCIGNTIPCKGMVKVVEEAVKNLEKDNEETYQKCMKDLLKIISESDERLKLYIEEVIKQAEVKKGSELYKHGLSIAKVCELMGISHWELMSYVGKTRIADYGKETFDIRKRMDFARSIFQ